ncbi:hypothetical protein BS47DRAFT_1394396 [Hydnum rufescens UP504]|uniref:HNH nuclease domain-containing protein n=1 Tax=Hydnum rufescens UP504 TaxID=1448309 RepID=A0A9P6AV58_9AGAM|nr:hypothetical protein BS47DRAFT_1394396 [Hydnum rufescens UP504]
MLAKVKVKGSPITRMNSTLPEQATLTCDRTPTELEAGTPENGEDKNWARYGLRSISLLAPSPGCKISAAPCVERDGYQCVVTGLRDKSHSVFPPSRNPITTNAGHILRRAVVVYDGHDPDSRTSRSVLVTLDILRHYASLPETFVEEIGSIIDDPSNGMTVEYNARVGFDDFGWSLRAAPNTYRIVYHVEGAGRGLILRHKEEVAFMDSSPKSSESSSPGRKQRITRSGNSSLLN